MLKSWHNSPLKEIVPSEKEGAKFCVKLAHAHTPACTRTHAHTHTPPHAHTLPHTHTPPHTHTRTHTRTHTCTHMRAHPRTHTHVRTRSRTHTHTRIAPQKGVTGEVSLFPGAMCLRIADDCSSIALGRNVLRRPLAVESPLHCRDACRSSPGGPLETHPCLGACAGGQPGVKRGPQFWPHRPALCVCVICSANSLTRRSLNTALPSEVMMGDLRSGTYLLLTQKCQNWMHFPLCEMETWGLGLSRGGGGWWGRGGGTAEPWFSGSCSRRMYLRERALAQAPESWA